MKNLLLIILVFAFCNCQTKTSENVKQLNDELSNGKNIETDEDYPFDDELNNEIYRNIFADTFFSFLNIDSINIEFLENRIVNTFYYDFEKWIDLHYKYFKTELEYYDCGCYLISKQTKIGSNIFGVIDYRCTPIDGSFGYLYTIKDMKIIDSIKVAGRHFGGQEGNEFYYKSYTTSKFYKNMIETHSIVYSIPQSSDPIFISEEERIIAEIKPDGVIVKSKINNAP